MAIKRGVMMVAKKEIKRKGRISVYIEPELKEAFEKVCKSEHITVSTYIVRMIQQAVDNNSM
jgi:antitoxin component of RelBE/YafQ-DinJ toxin-antitoxin module